MLGGIIGANQVLGKVGVGGVPAIISIQKEFWLIYGIITVLAIIVPFFITIFLSKLSNQEVKEMVEESVADQR